MHPKDLSIQNYTYDLPDGRIASYPLEERDASKLLIYKDGNIEESQYRHIADHLPADTLLLLNETKVVPARLLFKKPTGGVIEIFCLEPDASYPDVQTAMQQRGSVLWQCLVGGASKWKGDAILTQHFDGLDLHASIVDRAGGTYIVKLEWNDDSLSFAVVLQIAGKIPLPPYMQRDAEEGDKDRYQTVYSKHEGSVAAPTAGLHFTDAVFQSLQEKGIETDFVTLHVGAGTFKPVKAERMEDHDMHAEWIDVSVGLIEKLLSREGAVITVGTTTLRTIESLYWIGAQLATGRDVAFTGIAVPQWLPYELDNPPSAKKALTALKEYMSKQGLARLITRTQIIIAPGYHFKIAEGLITNFHQPQSTLLLLVAALIGEGWRKVYNYGMEHDYRFLSYGDGSLLWKTSAP